MSLLNDLMSRPIGATLISTLFAALCWGLAGGFSHCIGMCGVFVITAGKIDDSRVSVRLFRQTLFQLGRLVSLALIGLASGWIGSLAGFALHFAKAQGYISIGFGVILAALALGYVGLIPWLKIPEPDVMGAGDGAGRKLFGSAMRSSKWYQPFSLGIMVGLLPCMLTYTVAIAAASTLSPWRGAAVLFAFWLGTIPGLMSLGMLSHAVQRLIQLATFRIAMTRIGAIILFATGVAMIWRGWANLA
jgi:sulfite exporter TauE/SafE